MIQNMFFGGIEIRITNRNMIFKTTRISKLINPQDMTWNMIETQLEILSFATNHYATGMQLVVICNYLGDVCNYKFGIV